MCKLVCQGRQFTNREKEGKMGYVAELKNAVVASTLPRILSLYYLIKSTKNWFSVLLVRYGKREKCRVYFRNGYELSLSKKEWQKYILHTHLFSLLPSTKLTINSIVFDYHGRQLKFNFGTFGFDTVFEVFAFDPYRDFLKIVSPKGKQVVDIGAAFGDTAIYFLLEGANHVVAIEAFPSYFQLAEQNLKINGFEDQSDIILSAVGGEPGNIVIDPALEDMFGANLKKPEAGQMVPVITLTDIVKRYNVTDGFLKLDTEGFEYEILLKTPKEVLRKFSDMLIEYHYGFEKLEEYLRDCGYSMHITGPTHVYMPHLVGEGAKNMYTGHIVAKRLD
jgi:FkbM family methyltransferase